jgi:hypothetical protein
MDTLLESLVACCLAVTCCSISNALLIVVTRCFDGCHYHAGVLDAWTTHLLLASCYLLPNAYCLQVFLACDVLLI